ncbi:MAG: radical SAM protein [Desulforhabdus sp.]|nr:radical SAM protein [Desulforhabdus sp.]
MKNTYINPPFRPESGRISREQRSPAITKSGTFYYPMWLSYAAGFLENRRHRVQLLDAPACGLSLSQVIQEVRSFGPELLVLSTSTPSIRNDSRIAGQLKTLLPDSFVALVGVHVSAMPHEALNLNRQIDAVVVGEYEQTLAELAESLEAGQPLVGVAGLVYRSSDDDMVLTPVRKVMENLDSIPWVSRTYRKHLNYRNYFYSGNRYPVVVFVTSRGCPNKCNFCVYPQTITGRKYRTRSVTDAVDEMEFIIREFSPLGEIMFEDDTFNVSKSRTIRFAEEILRRGLKVRWSCNARPDLDLETMIIMSKAGCRSLLVGFETGSQAVLNGMRKNSSVQHYTKFMSDTKKAGLLVNGTFMVGTPNETKQTMRETLALAKSLNPDVAQFFPVMIYPGTELYEMYSKKGYLITDNFDNWLNENGLHNCVVNLPGLKAKEMVEFCDGCRRRFYLRPSYLSYKLWQSLRYPAEALRTLKAVRIFAKHLFLGTRL